MVWEDAMELYYGNSKSLFRIFDFSVAFMVKDNSSLFKIFTFDSDATKALRLVYFDVFSKVKK